MNEENAKKKYCPFSHDLKEAQSQILVILLQIRSTLSTWVEMTIKLVLHVTPLVTTPHYTTQGLFLITLDVKPAVLCMRGTNESCFPAIWGPALLLHFRWWCGAILSSFLQYHQAAPGAHILHHPSKEGQLMMLCLGATVPFLIISSTTRSMRFTEPQLKLVHFNIWNFEKSSLKKIFVKLFRSSKVFLIF